MPYAKLDLTFEQSAVVLSHNQTGSSDFPRRRYWVAWLLGQLVGPLVMAFSSYRQLKVGVWKGGKWTWWEVTR